MLIWFMNERLVNNLFSSLRTFGFLFGYLPVSFSKLITIKKQKNMITTDQYDRLVHRVPQLWSNGILQRTKSTFIFQGEENLPSGPVLFTTSTLAFCSCCIVETDFLCRCIKGKFNSLAIPFAFKIYASFVLPAVVITVFMKKQLAKGHQINDL